MDGVQLARPGRPPLPRRPETSVDVLLLGATKNGALSADAVVFLIWTRLWILNFVVSEAIICSQKCGFVTRGQMPVLNLGCPRGSHLGPAGSEFQGHGGRLSRLFSTSLAALKWRGPLFSEPP
jgi:hypothetical protein